MTLNLGYTPIEGTRLSLFVRAQTDYFGFDTLGGYDAFGNPLPTFDDSNSNGHTSSLLGRIGGTTRLFGDRLESGVFVGQLQDDRRYLEPLASQDPNQAFSDSRYHAYRTDVQWNNTLHLDDLVNVPGLSASAITFGYEFTGDTAKVRVNENSVSGPYAELGSQVDDNRCDLRRAADHGAETTGSDRSGSTGLGGGRCPNDMARRRGFRRAGDRDTHQAQLWNRLPCTVAVRTFRCRFVRLCRQPQSEAGAVAGMGNRLHHRSGSRRTVRFCNGGRHILRSAGAQSDRGRLLTRGYRHQPQDRRTCTASRAK